MLTRHAITRRADTDGVDGAVVERDYVLTHIVAQLHRATMEGAARLVFKGGTALRLVHLGDYRYSADLDFTILGGNPSVATTALAKTLEAAREHTGLPVLQFSEGDSPGIEYIGPLGASKPRLIKLDISDSKSSSRLSRGRSCQDCGRSYLTLCRSMSIRLRRSRRRSSAA